MPGVGPVATALPSAEGADHAPFAACEAAVPAGNLKAAVSVVAAASFGLQSTLEERPTLKGEACRDPQVPLPTASQHAPARRWSCEQIGGGEPDGFGDIESGGQEDIWQAKGGAAREGFAVPDARPPLGLLRSYVVTARAPSFLYHQVRLMVGVLKAVGCGAMQPSEVKRILDARDINTVSSMAPACGLYLTQVRYGSTYAEEASDED